MHFEHTTSAKMISAAAFLAAGLLAGCTTDDASNSTSSGGSSGASGGTANGAGSGGKGGTSTGNGGSANTVASVCATKALVAAPPIATFDSCTIGLSDEAATSGCTVAAIGGTTIFGGVFSYDDGTGNPSFSVVSGHTSGAIGLTSTERATAYGGGFGIWTTGCFNASAYEGITFWARGIAPDSGKAAVTVVMAETIPAVPAAGATNRGSPG